MFARQDAEKPFLPRLPKKFQMFLDPAAGGTRDREPVERQGGVTHSCRMGPRRAGHPSGGRATHPEDGYPVEGPFSVAGVQWVAQKCLDPEKYALAVVADLARRRSRSEASVGRSAHPLFGVAGFPFGLW